MAQATVVGPDGPPTAYDLHSVRDLTQTPTGELRVALDGGVGSSEDAPSYVEAVDGLPPGRAPAANSVPTVLSNEDFAALLSRTSTNRSATVGTSASTPMVANAGRRGWKIKNDTASAIWINFHTTATAAAGGGNFKVAAGGYLASEPAVVETGAMSAIGEAAALAITIIEW